MSMSAIKVYHRCGGCGKKQEFVNSGKFRVNANGNRVDVWLIYRCKKCKEFLPQMGYEAESETDYEIYFEKGREGLFCELWIPVRKK